LHSFPSTILTPLIPIYSSINFLAGNPLNRASWLRSSPIILNNTAHSPYTRWLLLNAGDPLVQTSTGQLALLSASHLQPIFGWRTGFDDGDGNEGINEGTATATATETTETIVDESKVFGQVYVPPDQRKGRHGGEFAEMMTARVTSPSTPPVVFLGVLEPPSSSSPPSSNTVDQPADAVQVGDGVKGVPYFALDVAGTGKEQEILGLRVKGHGGDGGGGGGGGVEWGFARFASVGFTKGDAAIFGEARSMLDWNARNKVCVSFPPSLTRTILTLSC
jgi:NAD+ diphosphatase